MAGARLDVAIVVADTACMVRADARQGDVRPVNEPDTGLHPSGTTGVKRHNESVFLTLTQVLGNRALNEVKGGFDQFDFYDEGDRELAGTSAGR